VIKYYIALWVTFIKLINNLLKLKGFIKLYIECGQKEKAFTIEALISDKVEKIFPCHKEIRNEIREIFYKKK